MDPRREARRVELTENHLVFVTNGCFIENSATLNSEIRAGIGRCGATAKEDPVSVGPTSSAPTPTGPGLWR